MRIAELEALINRIKHAQPALGRALALSKETSELAEIYGEMIYQNAADTDQLKLSPTQLTLLKKHSSTGR